MFTCNDCVENFEQYSEYLGHVRYSHSGQSNYHCGAVKCTRNYSSFDTFRKHLRLKHSKIEGLTHFVAKASSRRLDHHNLSEKHAPYTNENISTNSEDSTVVNETISSTESDSKYACTKTPTSSPTAHLDPCALFAAKLHSYFDLPRSRVTEILHDVNEMTNNIVDNLKQQ